MAGKEKAAPSEYPTYLLATQIGDLRCKGAIDESENPFPECKNIWWAAGYARGSKET